MKLTLREFDCLPDWYVIERAEHDGTEWFEEHEENGVHFSSFMTSARISDADIEGTAAEMLEIAKAIRSRGRAVFYRCAVRVDGEAVYFWSPRNSNRDGMVTLTEAHELATEIETKLRGNGSPP